MKQALLSKIVITTTFSKSLISLRKARYIAETRTLSLITATRKPNVLLFPLRVSLTYLGRNVTEVGEKAKGHNGILISCTKIV